MRASAAARIERSFRPRASLVLASNSHAVASIGCAETQVCKACVLSLSAAAWLPGALRCSASTAWARSSIGGRSSLRAASVSSTCSVPAASPRASRNCACSIVSARSATASRGVAVAAARWASAARLSARAWSLSSEAASAPA